MVEASNLHRFRSLQSDRSRRNRENGKVSRVLWGLSEGGFLAIVETSYPRTSQKTFA
jgi:hypothetical protein